MLRKLILTAATLGLANKVYRDYRVKQRASGGGAPGLSTANPGPATDIAGHDLNAGSNAGLSGTGSTLGVNTGVEPGFDRPFAH